MGNRLSSVRIPAWLEAQHSSLKDLAFRLGSRLEFGSGLVAGLEAQLGQLVSACFEAQLGSHRDSTQLCLARYPGIGSVRLRRLR